MAARGTSFRRRDDGVMTTIWFTSDNHFGHANIIKHAERPFDSVEEMDAEMILRWNRRVKNNDLVYHLGDFTLGNFETAHRYFTQLNGCIKILGNPWHHDSRWLSGAHMLFSKSDHPIEVIPSMEVLEFHKYSETKYPQVLVLCHYPLGEWDRKHYGSWHLHGHSHGRYIHKDGELAFDVGVDCHEFYPINLDAVAEMMSK
jgi:calcineurin-like phosphoesterase family protein